MHRPGLQSKTTVIGGKQRGHSMSGEKQLTWFKWAEEATNPAQAARKPEALDDLE
jgi:hypothetical protein